MPLSPLSAGPGLHAGAATVAVTPRDHVFLFGYPHVPRISTGVHDPLECAALYLRRGDQHLLFLANDVIFVPKARVAEIRRRVHQRTGVPAEAVMVTATHTHSGPVMVDYVSNAADPVVPRADPGYLDFFVGQVVDAAEAAVRAAVPAELGLAVAHGGGIGGNRHDPRGPADLEVPVVSVRALATHAPIALMLVCAMHPTVLHEDSLVISADFPGFTRQTLQAALGTRCPVLFHQGASGNQSPRHVTRANTMAEAQRLGELLGRNVLAALPAITYRADVGLSVRRTTLVAAPRTHPAPDDAAARLQAARDRFERLRAEGATRQLVRTAECDVFGAEEALELARAAHDGRIPEAVAGCLPAEIQAMTIGPWTFVGWPGEFFVEFALELRRRAPGTFVITMANGELQGYIVTEEAARRGVYESTNALFAPENGGRFVAATLALLGAGS